MLLNGQIVLTPPKGKFLNEQITAIQAFRNAPVVRRAFLAVAVAASVASCVTPPVPVYAVGCIETVISPGDVVHTLDNGNHVLTGNCPKSKG